MRVAVFVQLLRPVVLAELALYHLELLAQVVLALVAVHLLLRALGDVPLYAEQRELAGHELA